MSDVSEGSGFGEVTGKNMSNAPNILTESAFGRIETSSGAGWVIIAGRRGVGGIGSRWRRRGRHSKAVGLGARRFGPASIGTLNRTRTDVEIIRNANHFTLRWSKLYNYKKMFVFMCTLASRSSPVVRSFRPAPSPVGTKIHTYIYSPRHKFLSLHPLRLFAAQLIVIWSSTCKLLLCMLFCSWYFLHGV